MNRAAVIALPLLVASALPGVSAAATATVEYEPPLPGIEPQPAYLLAVRAEAGETNFLDVTHDGTAYVVRDAGTPLTAGAGCARIDVRAVRCATPRTDAAHSVFVNAGDGADFAGVRTLPAGARVELHGGPEADYLVGGASGDLLMGGDDGDRISGRGGADTIDGGTGGDEVHGGAGRDTISYESRRRRVHIDLGAETGGAEGEADRLVDIEDAVGGRGRDTLAGDGTANRLVGGAGRAHDHLVGHGGPDALTGHRVSGGPGDDSLDGRIASCERGRDRLMRIHFKLRGPFPLDCERVVAGAFLEITPDPVRINRRTAVYRLRCIAAIGRCAGTLRLRDRRGALGGRRFARRRAVAARETTVSIPLRRRPRGRVGALRVGATPAYRRDGFRTRLR